ncbi:cobalt-precorrin-5B (C(1))-methyltransferase [Parendozoicomonas haliclonae]|uniref:Cobalt-precorrin-5B C(1)-methyltransferase n=1 Tax=Parendozoicomonas haliclonae TaxID=1960125 RepID=A0A1X7AM57_9GAMM|nr:cobalt-precorrin-5B (C(1))-methyltransferase [Parendozoicomonas haliclonae]SMA48835.1 cobalt-precorrin-6A synthase [Parendozoicomonas haliclonae]
MSEKLAKHSVISRNRDKKALRPGFTTGACAAAAARAAAKTLLSGEELKEITITLPIGQEATFAVVRTEWQDDSVICTVIKDAGDDPDCTHGAEICAQVRVLPEAGIQLEGGEGVARVTKPGLGLEVGGPAINPVPRKNIIEMVQLELDALARGNNSIGADVIISVPAGRELAKQTISERLGLIDGISILGTRGTVKPFSTSAYASSVRQTIEVATVNGTHDFVLTTGGRTEKFGIDYYPSLTKESFVQAGDFVGVGLRSAARYHARRVMIVGMIGKIAKLADGAMMTHVSGPAVNFVMLADLAAQFGADETLCAEIRTANTARHVFEMVEEAGLPGFYDALCEKVVDAAAAYGRHAFPVECLLIDFQGQLLGSARQPTFTALTA